MATSAGRGDAPDASIQTRSYLETIADERESAVTVIEAKLAGTKQALATAKNEARAARAAAGKGD